MMIEPHAPLEHAAPSARLDRSNPFQGLAYFEAANTASFAGRGRDIQELSSEILRQRRLILYGRSGLGKTSLLLAGVLPRLREQRCKTVYVRALLEPARDLFSAAHEQLEGDHKASLPTLIAHNDSSGPVVIVFDQFEEFFIRFSDRPTAGHGDRGLLSEVARHARDRFLEEITALIDDVSIDVRVVFSLREDWFAEMESFEAFLPSIMRNAYRLLPLTAFGVREAITRALKVADLPFDPPLVSGLVEQLADVHFDPAILQMMCTEIWAQAAARSDGHVTRLELCDLTNVGSLSKVFARYLEHVAARIPRGEQQFSLQVRSVLDAMITPHRTKRAAPRAAFLELPIKITDADLERVLSLLCEAGLARRDERRDGPWYELIHERLIHSILAWLDEDASFFQFRDALRTVRTLSASARWKRDPERLLNRGQLEGVVGPYKALLQFSEEERLFLLHSAVYAGSNDTEHWASQNELAMLEQLVRALLASREPTARARGADAISRLAQLEHLRGELRELALNDSVEAVRRAAAQAYARRVPDQELEALGLEVSRSWRQPHLLDLAAEVLRERRGHAPSAWGPFSSYWVRRRLYRQRKQDLAENISKARSRVWFAAPGAALLWSASIVPLATYSVVCVSNPSDILNGGWVSSALVISIGLFLLGSAGGWRAGRRAIACAAGEGEEGQFAAAIRLPEIAVVPSLVAGASLVAALEGGKLVAVALASLLWAPILLAWLHLLGRLAGPSIWAAKTIAGRWRWSLLWSLGGTLAPALGMWLVLGTPWGSRYWKWIDSDGTGLQQFCFVLTLLPLATPLLATLSFVGLATSSAVSPLPGEQGPHRVGRDPELSEQRVRRARQLGIALAILASATFLVAHGLRVFPLPGYEVRVSVQQPRPDPLEVPQGRAPFDTTFVKLRLDAEVPHVVQSAWQWQEEPRQQAIALFPAGQSQWLAVHAEERIAGAARAQVHATLLPQIERATLSSNDWQFHVVSFENVSRPGKSPRWEGSLALTAATDAKRVQACFTGAVVSEWADLSLWYAAPDGSSFDSSGAGRSAVTAHHQVEELAGLRKAPSGSEPLDELFSSLPPCLWVAVDAERISSTLPGFTPRDGNSPLVRQEQPLFALFLVRGDTRDTGD